jgi:hypothetical protein
LPTMNQTVCGGGANAPKVKWNGNNYRTRGFTSLLTTVNVR